MRVSREEAQASRQRIIDRSAELFRERGFEGIGIADLMKSSGMTHGGFYRHFSSKEDLAKEAVIAAYQQFEQGAEGKSIEALLARYMSEEHRDDLGSSCPITALGVDAMRQAESVKKVFAEGVKAWLSRICQTLEHGRPLGPNERRALAIDLAARAVGAIVLSRASAADSELSDEILRTCLTEGLRAARPSHDSGLAEPRGAHI